MANSPSSPTTNVQDVSQSNFDNILKTNKIVIADFWAPWCGPCKQTEPMFGKVAEKYADKASFVRINSDENPDLMQRYSIMSVPAFLILKDGQVNDTAIGAIGQGKLEGMVEKQISSS